MSLPAIYPNSEAVARHAAGLFQARGHREIAYFRAESTSLSDHICSKAFASEARRCGMRARLVTHPANAAGVRLALADALASRPRISGLFIGSSEHALTVLCHLLGVGLRIPDEVALLCAWDDDFLRHTHPVIASYRIDGKKMGERLSDMVLDLIRHRAGRSHTAQMIPEYLAGGTI